MTYADYTASGRALGFVGNFIRDRVLPSYANTHTESSGTGLQTTRLREDAREIIRQAVHGDDDSVVIFAGSHRGHRAKLIGVMGLRIPRTEGPVAPDRRHCAGPAPGGLHRPYEHHSNEVSWRETIADVVTIRRTSTVVSVWRISRQLPRTPTGR